MMYVYGIIYIEGKGEEIRFYSIGTFTERRTTRK